MKRITAIITSILSVSGTEAKPIKAFIVVGQSNMVDGHVFPNYDKPHRYALYSELLAHFIRDVRKDFNAPKTPFAIGVMGVGGLKDQSSSTVTLRQAMAAPAEMLECKSNLVAVQTAPFWSDELAAIDSKRAQAGQIRFFLDSKHQDHADADGKMNDRQKSGYLKRYETDLISPAATCTQKPKPLPCRLWHPERSPYSQGF